jgi:D-3-phosphoglycerate dehydrogenase
VSSTDRPTVLVTQERFEEAVYAEAVEAAGGEVVYGDIESEADLVEACRDAAVVVGYNVPITRAAFEAMKTTQLVFQTTAGYDSVDVAAANEQGVPVSTPRGYAADEVAEHAIALALAVARDVPVSDRDLRESAGFGERRHITPLSGSTFGVVGLGAIGSATVPKARGLGMDVVATDPYAPGTLFEELGVERLTFEETLERADVLSLHCPLTAETRGLISTPELDRMPDGAVLVNTARGPIVDERALVDAVDGDRIGGAGIDVFESEPPDEAPTLDCEEIVCSPHHAALCEPVLDRMKRMAREEICRALRGERLQYVVNPEALMYREEYSPEFEMPEEW